MKGIPHLLQTKTDWENAYQYVMQRPEYKKELKCRLQALKQSGTAKFLKDGVVKTVEEQTPNDYEDRVDPNMPLAACCARCPGVSQPLPLCCTG